MKRLSLYILLLSTGLCLAQNADPVPTIDAAKPSTVAAGSETSVTLSGTGFTPTTTIFADGREVRSHYVSSSSMTIELAVPSESVGLISVGARKFGASGGTPGVLVAISSPIGIAGAARVLDQTTFGATPALIGHVQQEGLGLWLKEQFEIPATLYNTPPYPFPSGCISADLCAQSEWWRVSLTGKDQLRQRVAFALSEIFVISDGTVYFQAVPPYANLLANDAFGNWSTIMKDVTLSTGMGIYLNMINSGKATGSQIANENFARENLQLFNLGLSLLNQDGTPKLNSGGATQQAYSEDEVEAFARAFTGWTYANTDGSTPKQFVRVSFPNYQHPMVAVDNEHDTSEKRLLTGMVLPAGQTAKEDLDGALSNIFEHPNVPPFVCRQLIQHLVTGNPSPGYVSRVADRFIDDGNGVRGNMKAVIDAILSDPEARAGDLDPSVDGGHLREPLLWMTGVMRGMGYVNTDPGGYFTSTSQWIAGLGEEPYDSSSVFSFFPPSYDISSTILADEPNEPEFALENTGSIGLLRSMANRYLNGIMNGLNAGITSESPLVQLSSRPSELVDALGLIFLHGRMDSAMRKVIIDEANTIPDLRQRTRIAAYLVITSADYKIIH